MRRAAQGWVLAGSITAVITGCSIFSAEKNIAAKQEAPFPHSEAVSSNALTLGQRIVPGFEEPLIATGQTSAAEDKALDNAIAIFRASPDGDTTSFESFLAQHPKSNWRMAVAANLGLVYYRNGFFSRAMSAWDDAWQAGRSVTEPRSKALADRAVGELARMHARVGHADELKKLFAEIGDRPISGPATEMITGAREGLWMFQNEPGVSYLCGPMALKNVLISLKADKNKIALMDAQRSGRHGFNFVQVSQLATQVGLEHELVFRSPDQPIPVPSVVNWKLNHYAAIVGVDDKGRYHIKDPTFAGGDAWISKRAIDEEGSGYFLVPTRKESIQSKQPWREISKSEARLAYGMGYTGQNQPGSTTPCDDGGSSVATTGMCAASTKSMVVSLNLSDTPVVYRPPVGPSPQVRLTYNQREANQPAVFSFFNVSPKWTLNVLSWVQDNPTSPGRSVLRYVAGGGSIDYSSSYNYSTSTGQFSPERQGQAVLVRIPATGAVTSYELRMPDGSKQVFAQADGAATTPRRLFLSQIIDAAGNALSFHYDAQLRLTSITDATGRDTSFSYEYASNPLLVTKITDPFGRHADLSYDTSGRLVGITDVIGITSSFTYDAAGLIKAMATPYGTSSFVYGDGASNTRYLETTDPMGFTDRLEFRHQAPGMPYSDSVTPAGMGISNQYLYYRNSFYWDKNIYPNTHTDYTQAYITHWLHNPSGQTSPIIESTKAPLERRVWRTYPGQGSTISEGTTGTPISISRVLDDGSTQAVKLTYNTFGKPLTVTDPAGRVTRYTYDTNNIDILKIEQKTSASGYSTIASFTYNNQHLPLTYTDAAGQNWSFSYNGAGQLVSETDPLLQTTRYEYDSAGYLQRIVNANGQTAASYTRDSFGRIASRTDSQGHVVTYAYDNFDRLTRATFPDGTFRSYAYDKLDVVATTDRLGRITRYTYDANRRLTSVIDALGRTTSYGYYPNGALKSLTDPKGNVTTWQRDIQSRVIAKIYADGKGDTYTYEAATSRLKSITDALNQVKNFTYTIDNHPASRSYTNALNATPSVSYAWDAYFPRPVSMTDGNGTTTFQYKPLGNPGALQLAVEDGPYTNDAVAYDYDALGRVLNRTVDSSSDNFAYDPLGRITSRANALGSFTYGYLGQTEQPTVQSLTGSSIQTQWEYEDNAGDRRLKAITNFGQARSFAFATRPENLIDLVIENASGTQKLWSYSYDNVDRLTGAQASTGAQYGYGYDDADNITSIQAPSGAKSFAHNSVNQINDPAYRYDTSGTLTEDDQRTYQWDAQNRLAAIGYKSAPTRKTLFRYDGMGRRVAIIEQNGTTTTETRYTWCGETLCQARTAGDVVTRRYFSEGEVWPQGGTKLYYGTDQLGSVRDVLAAPTGSKVASYDYDSYGNATSSSGRIFVDFRYAGMFYHQTSGLYLTQYRAYDPRTGRWLSRDPIEEEGGLNLYGYVAGNPVSFVDRSGLQLSITCIAGGPANPACDIGIVLDIPKIIGVCVAVAGSSVLSSDTPHSQECDKEWKDARDYCEKLYDDGYVPTPDGKSVGGKNLEQCVAGQVSEACGGNPIE